MGAALLTCEHVSLSYDGLRRAVADVSFTVESGSIFALVGPNGAGKTTTLRMLATLTEPQAGTIRVGGHDVVRDREAVRRRVGYLPDHFALYDHLTPVEYLEFFARLYGVSHAVTARRIDELLEEFELATKRDAPIRTLSRGMRQRLGVAKTLVHGPDLLVLDEPASALDPGARLKLRDALARLKGRGLAVVISSHILPDLAELADAVGIMEGGRMIHAGPLAGVAQAARAARTVYAIEIAAGTERARRVLGEAAARGTPSPSAQGGSRASLSWKEPAPGRFDVELEGGADAVADLVEALVLRGARVAHVAPRESALEAVYRQSAATKVA